MSRAAILLSALVVTVALSACGGSSKKSTTTATTSPTTTASGGHHAAPRPLQQVVAHVKGATLGNSATVSAGTPAVIVVRVPSKYATNKLTINIARTAPTVFTATSSVAGTSLHQASTIHVGSPNAEIALVRWGCVFPKGSTCPIHVASSSPTHVKLEVPNHPSAVELTMLPALPGTVKTPSLISLGLPAPGSPVQATVKVTAAAPASGGKRPTPPKPSSSVSAVPGSVIAAIVQVPPGAPAQGTLRIAVPKTLGHTITIQAGGTSASPASTATVTSSAGDLHISSVEWACQLPPTTFCPFKSIHTTTGGFEITLPTPRIPVSLSMITDKG